jgi:LuxR family maltose regulon positive regulatory protein
VKLGLMQFVSEPFQPRLVRPHDPGQPPESAPAIAVRALGAFDVRVKGRPLPGARKSQAMPLRLLKSLVAFGGRSVTRDRLIDVLWPEADGDAARQAFDTTLHRLRRLLSEPAAIVLRDSALSLVPALVWTDVWEVDRLLGELAANSRAEEGAPGLHRLAELYAGPLLDGEEEPAWTLARSRLQERVLRTILGAARSAKSSGDLDTAEYWYGRGLAIEPTCEGFYSGLMRCAAERGQKAEVLRVYRLCQKALLVVFGVEPSRATQELMQSALST